MERLQSLRPAIDLASRTEIAALPVVGPSLAELLDRYNQPRHQQRLLQFVESFTAATRSDSRNRAVLLTDVEEFLDVFEATVLRIMQERRKEKRNAFKNILVSTFHIETKDLDESEYFVRLVERMTLPHIIVLAALRNLEVNLRTASEDSTARLAEIIQLCGLDEEKVVEIVQDLENENLSIGFLSHLRTRNGNGGLFWEVQSYITDKGERLLSYMQLPIEC